MYATRLQGRLFQRALPELVMVGYSESAHGNICGYYRRLDEDRVTVYHWMNDEEKYTFLNSDSDLPKISGIKSALRMKGLS